MELPDEIWLEIIGRSHGDDLFCRFHSGCECYPFLNNLALVNKQLYNIISSYRIQPALCHVCTSGNQEDINNCQHWYYKWNQK